MPNADLARDLFESAYRLQMEGELELAIDFYKRSIELHPTAEAHTFLGWTYRFQGKLDDAILECKKAIAVDPTFGNPYNDIGAYLIERGQHADAIPWLRLAIESVRYDSYHYPWYNLGRAFLALVLYTKARECFARSLELQPGYTLAEEALRRLKVLLQ